MNNSQSVLLKIQDGIALITLNEPNSLNALSKSIKGQLLDYFLLAENDPEVKVIVLTGTGKAFSAGGDVKAMGERTVIESVDNMNDITQIITTIANSKKITMSAVNGYAMGAGFSLALATDLIYANTQAKFGLSFTKVGLVPDCGLHHFLPRIVGPWKAKELIFRAKILTAEEARSYLIVNDIFEVDTLLENVLQIADELSNSAFQALKLSKAIINNNENADLPGTLHYENLTQSIMQQTSDYQEGVSAFKEKRASKFTGR